MFSFTGLTTAQARPSQHSAQPKRRVFSGVQREGIRF
jgi:hypothetical protein